MHKDIIQKCKTITIIMLKVGFIFLAFFLIANKIDINQTLEVIESANIFYLLIAFVLSNVSLVFSGLRSAVYFQCFGLVLTKTFAVSLYYVGTFFNVVLPGGITGDGYKIYAIGKLHSFSKTKALRVILYERVNGFYVLALLGFLLFYFSDFMKLDHASYVNTALLIAITPCYLFGIKHVLKDKIQAVFTALPYSIVVQFLQILMAVMIIYSLPNSAYMPYIELLVLFVAGSILCILPVSIGGIGMRELTFLYGAELLGTISVELAVTVAFLSFLIYLATALVGLPILYVAKSLRGNKKASH